MFIFAPTTPLDPNTIRVIAESTNAMLAEQADKQTTQDAHTGGSRRHAPIGSRPAALPVS